MPAAIEWHDLLCRLGREGSPNVRRLGRYLTKNAGRIMNGLQLVSERDTDAKVNKYRVRNADLTGLRGLRAFRCLLSREEFKFRENMRNSNLYENNRLAETRQTP